MTPKHFAKLSKDHTWYATRNCSSKAINENYFTLDKCFKEMEEWAKSGIWYAHLTTLPDPLQEELKELGFNVYEYFGETGISWVNAKWGGMVKFEPEKHLLTLESGDVICGRLNSESLNFYMNNKTHATIVSGYGTISVIEEFINGNLRIEEIQKKSYWND